MSPDAHDHAFEAAELKPRVTDIHCVAQVSKKTHYQNGTPGLLSTGGSGGFVTPPFPGIPETPSDGGDSQNFDDGDEDPVGI